MVNVYFVFPLTVRMPRSGWWESQILVGVKAALLWQALRVLSSEPKRVTSIEGHDKFEVVERGVQWVQIVAVLEAGAEHVLSIANVVAICLSYLCRIRGVPAPFLIAGGNYCNGELFRHLCVRGYTCS